MTWRLYGSIPVGRRTTVGRSESLKISDGEKFKRTEWILDRQQFGPVWLKNALIAQLVVESILKDGGVKFSVVPRRKVHRQECLCHLRRRSSLPYGLLGCCFGGG